MNRIASWDEAWLASAPLAAADSESSWLDLISAAMPAASDSSGLVFGAAADGTAGAAPADDFGLSALGLEGLAPGLESLLNLF